MDSIASIGTGLNRRTRSWQQRRISHTQQFGVDGIDIDVFKNWVQGNFRLHAKVIGDLASFLSRQVEFSALRRLIAHYQAIGARKCGQCLHRILLLTINVPQRDQIFVILAALRGVCHALQ